MSNRHKLYSTGIWPIFYNAYKWSITFTNCEYHTAHLQLILQINYTPIRASLVAQTVKTLPAIQETQVQFLGWENPLQYSSWRIPWTEDPGER